MRTILAVQTGTVVQRSSADLLAELNAFESLRGEKRELFLTPDMPPSKPASVHPPDDAATPELARAAFLQQASFEAARQERVPSAQPVWIFCGRPRSRSPQGRRRLSLARRRQRKTTRSRPLWRFRTRNALRCSAERTVA